MPRRLARFAPLRAVRGRNNNEQKPLTMQVRYSKLLVAMIAATVIVFVAGRGTAHTGAKGIVGERMMAMKQMGDGMKQLAAMVTGKTPFVPQKIEIIATKLKTHAEDIPRQFPKGSLQKPTEALAVIWQKWDEFEARADGLAKLASELKTVAGSDNAAVRGVFAKIGKACSGCHQDFRLRKKE